MNFMLLSFSQEMYFDSKTEQYEQENYCPNEYYDHPTLTQGVIANDIALSKAIGIIEELKQNLSFALSVNEMMAKENEQLKLSVQRMTKKINNDALSWQSSIRKSEEEKEEIIEILESTRNALSSTSMELEDFKSEVEKRNQIILEQKRAYQELQQNFMNQSLNYMGDTSSMNIGKEDFQYVQQIERENNELQVQIKRLGQLIEKSESKTCKAEKENAQFRKWMAGVLGLQKVIEGSQKILMAQIAQRMLPA